MFGLSMGEVAVILLAGIIVIGPKELPTVIRALVRTLAQLRGVAQEFRRNFDDLAQEAEMQALKEDVSSLPTLIDMYGNPQPLYDISEELKADATRRGKVQDSDGEKA